MHTAWSNEKVFSQKKWWTTFNMGRSRVAWQISNNCIFSQKHNLVVATFCADGILNFSTIFLSHPEYLFLRELLVFITAWNQGNCLINTIWDCYNLDFNNQIPKVYYCLSAIDIASEMQFIIQSSSRKNLGFKKVTQGNIFSVINWYTLW